MTTAILSVKSTEKLALSATPVASQVTDYTRVVRVYSNRNMHISVGGDATTSHLPVAELTPVFIAVPANLAVSIVKGTGDTDGDVWVTETAVI